MTSPAHGDNVVSRKPVSRLDTQVAWFQAAAERRHTTWLYDIPNTPVILDNQDKVFATIKSSATLSLGTIEHANFSGCL